MGAPGSTWAHCQGQDTGTGVGVAWVARPWGVPSVLILIGQAAEWAQFCLERGG